MKYATDYSTLPSCIDDPRLDTHGNWPPIPQKALWTLKSPYESYEFLYKGQNMFRILKDLITADKANEMLKVLNKEATQ